MPWRYVISSTALTNCKLWFKRLDIYWRQIQTNWQILRNPNEKYLEIILWVYLLFKAEISYCCM